MSKRLGILSLGLICILLLVANCNPQPLPRVPTPIPTLPPATLPPEAMKATAPPAEEHMHGEAAEGATKRPGAVEMGSQIFETNCSVCHNLDATPKIGPGLARLFEREQLPNGNPFSEENLRDWIRTGGGPMPGFPLKDDEMEALIAFLKEATR